jgi:hypothetical protein
MKYFRKAYVWKSASMNKDGQITLSITSIIRIKTLGESRIATKELKCQVYVFRIRNLNNNCKIRCKERQINVRHYNNYNVSIQRRKNRESAKCRAYQELGLWENWKFNAVFTTASYPHPSISWGRWVNSAVTTNFDIFLNIILQSIPKFPTSSDLPA